MAYFKLSYLVPNSNKLSNTSNTLDTFYNEEVITEFHSPDSQLFDRLHGITTNDTESYHVTARAYSYNESVTFSKNAQATLSFSMTKKVLDHESWIDNPFVSFLQIGSLLLLTDKDLNDHLFIVKNIKYTLKDINLIYNYECEDAFSYQLIGQNNGYTINNDPSSSDYIGAKTIDWWIWNKIDKDCYISYDYLPLQRGLYRASDGHLKTFKKGDTLSDVKEIIKPIFEDEAYFETIPFSCSNSNGSAALISLAETLDFMLMVAENKIENGTIQKYYWVAPSKNPNTSNLEYSPNTNIQSFSFGQQGESLTTVLNILDNNINDETISLLPKVPDLFLDIFLSDNWNNSVWYKGYFHNILEGYIDKFVGNGNPENTIQVDNINSSWTNLVQIDEDSTVSNIPCEYIGIKIFNNSSNDGFYLSPLYNRVHFNASDIKEDTQPLISSFQVQFVDTEETSYSSINSHFALLLRKTSTDSWSVFLDGEEISSQFLDTTCEVAVGIACNLFKTSSEQEQRELINFKINHLYLKWYRNWTVEEEEFAQIADECPWLENKLIDFTYYRDSNLISKFEYDNLMRTIYNDLRIINGKLLASANLYYRAIHEKTEILSQLQNKLDTLGAICHADYIDSYQRTGSAATNTEDFAVAYNDIFAATNQKASLLNRKEELQSLFNKGFQAEQRFLKNLYYFQNYFNKRNTFSNGNNPGIWNNTISCTNSSDSNELYSFRKITLNNDFITSDGSTDNLIRLKDWPDDIPLYDDATGVTYYPIFTKQQQNLLQVTPVTKSDVVAGKYYTTEDEFNGSSKFVALDSKTHLDYSYHADKHYYLSLDDYITLFYKKDNSVVPIFTQELPETADDLYIALIDKSSSDSSVLGYVHKDYKYRLKVDTNGVHSKYIQLTPKEIERFWLLRHNNQYYIKDTKRLIPFDWIRWDLLLDDPTSSSENNFNFKYISAATFPIYKGNWLSFEKNTMIGNATTWEYYKIAFPIDSVSYIGPELIPYAQGNGEYVFKYYDLSEQKEKIYTPTTSKSNIKMTEIKLPFISCYNGSSTSFWNLYADFIAQPAENINISAYLDFITDKGKSSNNATKYYSFTSGTAVSNTATCWHFGATTFLLGPIAGMFVALASNAANYIASYDYTKASWTTENKPAFTFDTDNNYRPYITDYEHYYLEQKHRKSYHLGRYVDSNDISCIDSYYAIYARTDNAWNEYIELTKAFIPDNSAIQQWGFNYYNKIAITYSFHSVNKNYFKADDPYQLTNESKYRNADYLDPQHSNYDLWVKNKYFRLINSDSTLNKNTSYLLVPCYYEGSITGTSSSSSVTFIDLNNWTPRPSDPDKVFSALTYYMFSTHGVPLDLSHFDTDIIDATQLEFNEIDAQPINFANNYILAKSEWRMSSNDIPFLKLTGVDTAGNPTEIRCLVLEQQDYERGILISKWENDIKQAYEYITPDSYKINIRYYDFDRVYSLADNSEINILEQKDCLYPAHDDDSTVYNIYMLNAEVDQTVINLYTPTTVFNPNYDYYKKENDKFIPCYLTKQMLSDSNYYAYQGYQHQEVSFTSDTSQFEVILYKQHYDAEHAQIVTDQTYNLHIDFINKQPNNNDEDSYFSDEYRILYNNQEVNLTDIELSLHSTRASDDNFSNMTNGEFWYRYHTKTEWPTIFEYAAMIETELSTYWTTAYNASKYCQYFLPEYWQDRVNAQPNYFAKDIWSVVTYEEDSNTIKQVRLNHKYIPLVKIYEENNEIYLPKYDYYYHYQAINDSRTNDQLLNELYLQNVIQLDTLLYNPALNQFVNSLNTDAVDNNNWLQHWSVLENGKCNYYYIVDNGGGMTWVSLLRELSQQALFTQYSGLYNMQFQLLYNNYQDINITSYENYSNQKLTLWRNLYRNYPNIFLERTYQNSNATTSSELLKMSQLAFNDMRKPENNYSITLIDAAQLTGYIGQPLHIGDGIKLHVDHYYVEPDSVYQSLNQYLFITDIKYNLRKDTDINITVNQIKYQDKLLQSLVKLMK